MESTLSPSSVRWYSYKSPHISKALKDYLDIPHRGTLLRFCDADSLKLENAYRSKSEDIERAWWVEEASFTASPGKKKRTNKEEDTIPPPPASLQDSQETSWIQFMTFNPDETVGIPVKSDSYEVDLPSRIMKPSYWPSSTYRVLRGTWFAEKSQEWVPLREPLADQLEQAYISSIWHPSKGLLQEQSDGRLAARLQLTALRTSGISAVFYDASEMYLEQGTGFGWLKRLGATSAAAPTRYALRRGYIPPSTQSLLLKEADVPQESIDNANTSTPPTHLLLIVHGIGQNLQGANIGQDALTLRAVLQQVSNDAGGDANVSADGASCVADQSEKKKERIVVLPVQWRKNLSLEVDTLAASLRPPGIPALRQVLHSTAIEVLLYLTPLHRSDILTSLVTSLNAAYSRFLLRYPDFSGPVSLFAHSLGSVLCWDILCNQHYPGTNASDAIKNTREDALDVSVDEGNSSIIQPNTAQGHHRQQGIAPPQGDPLLQGANWGTSPVAIASLRFSVDRLILAGSPLGCFLALRGISQARERGLGTPLSSLAMQCHPHVPATPDGLPLVNRLYNLYHPYDPVGYRLEPLAYSADELSCHRPAMAPLASGGRRLHIAAQELGDSVTSAAGRIGSTLVGAFRFRSSSKGLGGGGGGGGASFKTNEEGKKEISESALQPKTAASMSMATPPVSPSKPSQELQQGSKRHGGDQGMQKDDLSLLSMENEDVGGTFPSLVEQQQEHQDQRQWGEMSMDIDTSTVVTDDTRATENYQHPQQHLYASHINRVAGGALDAKGGWPTIDTGRIDFSLQESSLESQYLSALSAHFIYWSSADVALFVNRAVKGMDVLSGSSSSGAVAWETRQGEEGEAGGSDGKEGRMRKGEEEVFAEKTVQRMVDNWNYS